MPSAAATTRTLMADNHLAACSREAALAHGVLGGAAPLPARAGPPMRGRRPDGAPKRTHKAHTDARGRRRNSMHVALLTTNASQLRLHANTLSQRATWLGRALNQSVHVYNVPSRCEWYNGSSIGLESARPARRARPTLQSPARHCVKRDIWESTRAAFSAALRQGARTALLFQDDACLATSPLEARITIAEVAARMRSSNETAGFDIALLGPSGASIGPNVSSHVAQLWAGFHWHALVLGTSFMRRFQHTRWEHLASGRFPPTLLVPSGANDVFFSKALFEKKAGSAAPCTQHPAYAPCLRALAPSNGIVFAQLNRAYNGSHECPRGESRRCSQLVHPCAEWDPESAAQRARSLQVGSPGRSPSRGAL